MLKFQILLQNFKVKITLKFCNNITKTGAELQKIVKEVQK